MLGRSMKRGRFKRGLSLFLVLAMLATLVTDIGITSKAADGTEGSTDTRVTDASTIDNWKRYFGEDEAKTTANAGGIWTDKSVFTDADELSPVTMEDSDNNFLIAMSAIAANKSITGYSTIPTDTMLVLDLSGSMVDNTATQNQNDTTDARVKAMVEATNDAIVELMALNQNNRVGVVLYSGNSSFGTSSSSTATVLLPLDRYTIDSSYTGDKSFLEVTTNGSINVRVSTSGSGWNSTVIVLDGNGERVDEKSKTATGGTYTQNGMYLAWQQFEAVTDTTIQDSFQAGTKRMPIMVLMSDGAPTTATTNFYNVGTSNVGNGAGSCATDSVGFLTQLTAAWVRASMENKYNNTAKFYTLGFGLSSLTSGQTIAESVLDPANSTTGIDELWEDYIGMSGNALTIHNAPGTNSNGNVGSQTIQVSKAARITSIDQQVYVDQYFKANTEAELTEAFKDIVDQIVIQSKYYPTEAEGDLHDLGGYISFEDDLGSFMEVKDLKGILLGETLYSGAEMANTIMNGGLGTTAEPTALGDEFIWSVMERLDIETVTDARQLVRQAWQAGQLSYTSATEFSNYIGWYADADGKYLGFWSEDHTAEDVPSGAVYAMKSYGYLGYGEITEESIKGSDLMYMTVRVQSELATGDQSVHWAIPASLIPTVNYEVTLEGKNYTEAKNVELKYKAANPVRLVYEVGLVEAINELTVADIMAEADHVHIAEDGSYYFYTNKWGDVNDDGETDIDYTDPYSHMVTTVDFEPSVENERYYYTEDSTVYAKDGDSYEAVDYDPKTVSDTYYHVKKVFDFSEATKGNDGVYTGVTIKNVYEQITTESLAKATKYADNDNWYIPAGTIYRLTEPNRLTKATNVTETLEYVTYPFIYNPTPETDADYHADTFLGNNGRISITPATGIKLSKTVDVVEPGTDVDNFEFVIALTAPTGTTLASSYPYVVFDGDGNQVGDEAAANVSDGKITLTLADGQTVYIKELPAGTTYTITESTHPDYAVKSVNGDESKKTATGTITEHVLDAAHFVNTLKTHGSLIISKTVNHPLGSNYQIPDTIKFTINVDLDGEDTGNATLQLVKASGTTDVTTDADGKFSFEITSGETVSIHNIPDGATYSVTETNLPEGFTLTTAESTSLNGTISTDVNAVERLVNTYTPDDVHLVNITLEGTKTVEGRRWLATDEFTFELQKFEKGSWVTVGEQKTVTNNQKSFDFTSELQKEVLGAVGTYQYRVIEVEGTIGGITYDKVIRYFDVTVTDADMDGKLEIAETNGVHETAPTVVTERTVSGVKYYDIVTDFTNKYAPVGSAQFEVDITKTIKNTTGVDVALSDFVFELYEATVNGTTWTTGNKVTESTATNALGEAVIGMVYELSDLTDSDGARIESRTYYYILKEKVPTDKIAGMEYTTKEYKVVVKLQDNLDGTMSTIVSVDGVLDSETSNVASATFENEFDLGETTVSIVASKKLSGRAMEAEEFEFGLYEATSDFIIGNMIATAKNAAAADGVASVLTFVPESGYEDKFDANNNLKYTAVGTYNYVVREIIPAVIEHNGITYDTNEYRVTVVVANDGNGGLATEVTVNGAVYTPDAADKQIAFNNGYTAAEVTEDFQGRKILNGRDQKAGEFTFELYETDSNYSVDGLNAIQTKTNTSTGIFAFEPIEYETVGTHYYVIKEAKGNLGGIKYSEEIYQIKVEVTDNGEGALETVTTVNGTVDGEITITNTYSVTEAKVTLEATKALSGRALNAGEFQFQLLDAEDKVVGTTKTNGTGATVNDIVFDELTFDSAGVYNYKMKEVIPDVADRLGGVVYDRTEFDIEITVTDDGERKLIPTVKVNGVTDGQIGFANEYSASGTSTTINASKVMKGRDLAVGEFYFDLRDLSTGRIIQTKGNAAASENEDGAIVFDTIPYSVAGTHTYTVSERNTGKVGVTYDTTFYTVVVEVTDNGKGQLEATQTIYKGNVSENVVVSAIQFNNYDPDDAEVILSGTKTLTGRRLRAGEFTFELYNAELSGNKVSAKGDAIDTDTNTETGAFSFDKMSYSNPGTHYYVVKENVPVDTDDDPSDGKINGITYDESIYYIKVEVTDDSNGTLKAMTTISKSDTLEDAVQKIEFGNTYTAADGNVRITGVTKELQGRDLARGEFEFQLILVSAPAGYTGHSVGDVVETVENGKVWDADKGEYINAGAVDQIVFDDLVYEHGETGEYVYKIVEVDNKLGGVTYSDAVYYVTIVVSDDESGSLVVSTPKITSDKEGTTEATPTFKNTYVATPAEVQLGAVKNLNGKDLHKGDFSFKLSVESVPNGATLTTAYTDEKSNGNVDGIAIKEIAFDKLSLDKAGTYVFTIEEKIPSDAVNNFKKGITYDATKYTVTITVTDNGVGQLVASRPVYTDKDGNVAIPVFTNTYTVEPIKKAIVGVTKILTGRDMKADEFTFQLKNEYGKVVSKGKNQAATAGQSAKVVFEEIEYSVKGTYEYTLEEVTESLGGVKYSEAKFKVTVEVTDNGDGTLTVGEPVFTKLDNTTAKPEFENKYTVEPKAKAVVGVTKILVGRDMKADEFTFQLLDKDGEVVSTGKNKAAKDGEFAEVVFEEIEYSAKGTYNYTVVEVAGELGGVEYSKATYKVAVEVVDNGDGTLTVKDAVFTKTDGTAATPVFTNNYTVEPKAKAVVGVTKVLTGRDMTAGEFQFELVNEGGKVVATGKNEAAKAGEAAKVVFEEIEYTAKGIYQYTVKEVVGTLNGVTYSEAKYNVTVKVTDNGDGTLNVADAVFTDAGQDEVKPIFTNAYTEPIVTMVKTQALDGKATTGKVKAAAGDIVTYAMNVINSGTASAKNIIVTDKVPEGLILIKDSVTGGDKIEIGADGTINWTILELEADKSMTVSFQVIVPEVTEATTWKNVAALVYDNNPNDSGESEEKTPENSNEVELITQTSPITGDMAPIITWTGLAFASIMLSVVLVMNKKRRSN